jgi:hypothetical protein
MFPEFTHPARPTHPGVVTFVGTDGVERAEPADRLPEWLAYAPDADGQAVPVVRVVRLKTDRNTGFRSYAADGRLLWVGLTVTAAPTEEFVTTPRPAAPRPAAAEPVAAGWF